MINRNWAETLEKDEGGVRTPVDAFDESMLPPDLPEPKLDDLWSVLTEPRQMGLGETLVTEGWAPERPVEKESHTPKERDPFQKPKLFEQVREYVEEQAQRLDDFVEKQAEKETVNPLKRRTADIRFDCNKFPNYFDLAAEARQLAHNALIDPYTDIVSEFAHVDPAVIAWERPRAGLYAYAAAANLKLGRLSVYNWSLRTAESFFKRALKADAHDPDAWWHLGVVKLFRRKNKEAVRAFQNASDCRPGNSRNRICLGLAQYHNKDYTAAEETFRYERSLSGRGVGALSFLACSLRMQKKWDASRMELQTLAQHPFPAWKEMAAQCERCVKRGEGIETGDGKRQRIWSMAQIIGLLGVVLIWVIFNIGEILDLIKNARNADWTALVLPASFLLFAFITYIRQQMRENETKELYGDGREDIPCWQTRAWMRPHKLDVFGQPTEIPRR